MSFNTQINPALSEPYQLKAYRWVTVFFIIPSISFVFWLTVFGANPDHYWQAQVNSFVYLNKFSSGQPLLWHNLTLLGDAYILLPLLSFAILFRPAAWAALFAAIPLTTLLVHGGKALAAVPRPAAVLDPSSINIIGKTLTAHNSLPSGHTATVFVAATVLAFVVYREFLGLPRWASLVFLGSIALLLGVSRIAVGAHWPLDIYFGAICGFFGGSSGVYLTLKYSRWWAWMSQPKGKLILGLIMLVWGISLLPSLANDAIAPTVAQWMASITGIVVASQLIMRFTQSRKHIAKVKGK